MRSQRRLLAGAMAALVLGIVLMVPFEAVATRILGVASLFAFIVLGVFAIASPPWLSQNDATAGDGTDAVGRNRPWRSPLS